MNAFAGVTSDIYIQQKKNHHQIKKSKTKKSGKLKINKFFNKLRSR